MTWFGIVSFVAAAIAYGGLTGVLIASHPGGRRAAWTIGATTMSAAWAAGTLVLVARDAGPASIIGLDALHGCAWTAAMLSWLGPSPRRGLSHRKLMLGLSAAFAISAVVVALLSASTNESQALVRTSALPQNAWLALLGIGLVGLLSVEQVYRNAREPQRGSLRFLCLGVGIIFVSNVFVYSQASLLGGLVPVLWEGRALAYAAAAPLVLIALKRQSEWANELFVSRQVAFYTATFVAVGAYLLAMGVVGYLIRAVGGQWGVVLELVFLIAAIAILAIVLFSSSIRARAKVFLIKHFYRNKYDYRHEWLQLTSALTGAGDSRALAASGLKGIASIVGSREGSIWLLADGGDYEETARLDDRKLSDARYDALHPVVAFLREHGWVIDTEEYAREPERYGNAFGDPENEWLPRSALFVPLDYQGVLQGFVVLTKPSEAGDLNFEDHDILKTAGRQVAVVIAQARAQEQLTAIRQFEAVNKLVTFMMHDLKNVVAQQELVVANAQRFGQRADFFEDAIATIRSGAERMRKLLDQLRSAAQAEPRHSRADATKVLMEVRSLCADREPVPRLEIRESPAWVDMDRDKLASVLTHVIRNAQDATAPSGDITIELERSGPDWIIRVTDTGIGMDPAFVRDRLFKPFDSTKGAKGMGIGAYQVRETVRAVGGDVAVRSMPGAGTTFSLRLPGAAIAAGTELPAASSMTR